MARKKATDKLKEGGENIFDDMQARLYNAVMADLDNDELRGPALYAAAQRILNDNRDKLGDLIPQAAQASLKSKMDTKIPFPKKDKK